MTAPVRRASPPALTGLVVLLVLVLGVPQVWADLREGGVSLDSVFYPVLLVAFGYLAIARR